MKNLLFLLLACLPFLSCEKDCSCAPPPESTEWFGFAVYYCECSGDCVTLYRIQDDQLYQGEASDCLMTTIDFPNPALSASKFEIAKPLLDALPDQLKNAPSETAFGIPDGGDWGGYRIFLQQNGVLKQWDVDTQTQNLPEWLKPYAAQIKATLEALQ